SSFFFFNDTATTEIYTLSLHDALPIYNESGFRPASCGPLFEYPTERRQIFATQAAPGANCGAGGGGRTLIPSEGCGILSPVRLPVPPLRQRYDSFEFTLKLLQAHCSGRWPRPSRRP